MSDSQIIVSNKKSFFNYEIEERFTCGMRLSGTEIKSIRKGDCSIKESFCYIENNEIFIKGMFVKKYEYGSHNNHEEVYDRKLLLTKREISKIRKKLDEKGFSLIPTHVWLIDGWVKIEIGLGKGKKNFDKRESLKKKDAKIEIDRSVKYG